MGKKKFRKQDKDTYKFDAEIPFKKLLKGSLIINFAPFLIIIIFVINGFLLPGYGIALFFGILILSLLFIYPYMADLQELTTYVSKLTSNKEAKKPSLSFLNNVEDLSKEIDVLNNSWKMSNTKLQRSLDKEIKTQTLLKDFVANASHEMKTPLASIKGFTETIQSMGERSETETKFLDIIFEQSVRLETLVQEMLVLSKLEGEEIEAKIPADFQEIVSVVTRHMSGISKERDIVISQKVSKNLPKIKIVETDITRGLENLVSNAIRYNDDKTKISILIKKVNKLGKILEKKNKNKAKTFIKITVKDNGIGIEKEEIPRLTERFYRVDKARSRKVGGSGLGLSIVSQIAENHGGFLDVKSEVGKGSEFSIYLPC